MKNIQQNLKEAIINIEQNKLSLSEFFIVFSTIIVLRIVVQQSLGGFFPHTMMEQFYEFTHTFLFFLLVIMSIAIVIYTITGIKPQESLNILLIGLLIILVPPIIDTLRFDIFWSYYEFATLSDLWYAFYTVFADTPHLGITDGARVEIILSTIGVSIYAYLRKGLRQSILIFISVYLLLFFLATLPSWIAITVYGWIHGTWSVGISVIAKMFLSPNPVLVQEITSINAVLNIHMSIVYAFIISIVSIGWCKKFHKKLWDKMIKNQHNWRYIGAYLIGAISVFTLDLQSVRIFTLSQFAIIATITVLFSIGFFTQGVSILYVCQKNKTNYHLGASMIIGAVLFSAIINIYIAGLYCVIISLLILQKARPIYLDSIRGMAYLLRGIQDALFYIIGVITFTNTKTILLSWKTVLFIVMLSMSMQILFNTYKKIQRNKLPVRLSRKVRLPVATMWFLMIFSTIFLFNLYAYVFELILVSSVVFIAVVYTKIRIK